MAQAKSSKAKAEKHPLGDAFKIKQVKSAIRREASQRETLRGLGLNKIGRERVIHNDSSIRGMLRKVFHLIDVRTDDGTAVRIEELY